jgi:hypothetical protein
LELLDALLHLLDGVLLLTLKFFCSFGFGLGFLKEGFEVVNDSFLIGASLQNLVKGSYLTALSCSICIWSWSTVVRRSAESSESTGVAETGVVWLTAGRLKWVVFIDEGLCFKS